MMMRGGYVSSLEYKDWNFSFCVNFIGVLSSVILYFGVEDR